MRSPYVITIELPKGSVESPFKRVNVAVGTRIAREDDFPGDFEPGARVVSGAFEAVELESVWEPKGDRCARWNTVAVIQVQPDVVQKLREARRQQTQLGSKADRSLLERAVADWIRLLPGDVGWREETTAMTFGFSSEPRPRCNTTVNHKTGQRVGLHLDSWDQLPPRERWRGSNRICINLGTAPRGFMFIPTAASDFADELVAAKVNIDSDPKALQDRFGASNLARRYLEVFPKQIVVRVWVLPGEAYVAPTENVVHDGYAPAAHDPDLSLTIRGHFAPLECRPQVFRQVELAQHVTSSQSSR